MQCHLHNQRTNGKEADEESPRLDDDFPNDGMNEDSQLIMNELFSKFKDNPELDTIHVNRLLEVLQVFGRNPSQIDCNRRIRELEEDEKFELTFEDFIEILDEPWTTINNDRNTLHKALARFDHTKEGLIDIEKFRETMRTFGEPLADDEIDDLIQLGLNDEEKKIDIELLLDQLLGDNT
ncbi:unnamed protein product [Rotaria sordida]|uniref:EF-hand domain-containing protein n=1 Tax=Rotaria sordida TaxID=392033 RepID=A0A819C2K6_9BILA|nr:unnamed protein product [Rotaria sordida]CAF1375201.1 unnamed protein product [Rotaria sordida]CAF3810876.1 unnamed protein product [Rotaria sordida]CAF3965855.1 unnamed protein product [Rotaria sordida]